MHLDWNTMDGKNADTLTIKGVERERERKRQFLCNTFKKLYSVVYEDKNNLYEGCSHAAHSKRN